MLKLELKRAFFSWSFGLAFLIGLIALGQGLYNYGRGFPISPEAKNADPFLYNSFDALLMARLGLISIVVPLLAALPFADSLALDRNSGYIRFLLLRTKRPKYIWSKFLANVLSGGMAVALPHIIIYITATIIFPEGLPTLIGQQRMIVTGPLSDVYQSNPALYVWFIIFLSLLFGVVYTTTGMTVACFSDNRYVVLASPFMFYIVTSFVIANLGGLEGWLPTAAFTPQQVTSSSWLSIFGEFAFIFIICTTAIAVFVRRGLEYA